MRPSGGGWAHRRPWDGTFRECRALEGVGRSVRDALAGKGPLGAQPGGCGGYHQLQMPLNPAPAIGTRAAGPPDGGAGGGMDAIRDMTAGERTGGSDKSRRGPVH